MDYPGQEERRNCPFFLKTGACRHGNGCRKLHNRPTISRTLLLSNMYQHPDKITMPDIDQDKTQKHFENFYIDIFEELSKYGEIESLNVCDNLASHMIGNVYVQFCNEEQAEAAMQGLKGRYYNNQSIIVDYIPVMDFFMATCRRLHWNKCNMNRFCNYIHVKKIRDDLGKELFGRYGRSYSWSYGWSSSYRRDRESRERSHERVDHRSSSERRTRSEGRSRSGSPSYRRDRESRERSHERVDHRSSSERRTRSEGRSRSRSPSNRRDRERRERSHERVDHRRRSNERRTRSEGRSRSRSPSYRRDRSSRERSHERGDNRRNSEKE